MVRRCRCRCGDGGGCLVGCRIQRELVDRGALVIGSDIVVAVEVMVVVVAVVEEDDLVCGTGMRTPGLSFLLASQSSSSSTGVIIINGCTSS